MDRWDIFFRLWMY